MKLGHRSTLILSCGFLTVVGCKEGSDDAAESSNSDGGATGTGGDSMGNDGGPMNGSGSPEEIVLSCPASALFCEGFENVTLDQWDVSETGGSLEIASSISFTGRSALLVEQPAGQAGGFLELSGAPLFPLPDNKMYGRMMVYFESIPAGHTDLIRGAGSNGAVPWYNVGHQYGEVLLNYFEEYPDVDCWARPVPGYTLPTGDWMCLEWMFDGVENRMDFYINGELERTVDGLGDGCVEGGNQTWEAPQFESLLIGAYNAQRSEMPNEGRLWIDDIAVGVDERMGCEPLR